MVRAIGVCWSEDNKVIRGLTFFDVTTKRKFYLKARDARDFIQKNGCLNITLENGDFVGTECPIIRLSCVMNDGEVYKRRTVQICNVMKKKGKTVGYAIVDGHGSYAIIDLVRLQEIVNAKVPLINATLVKTKNGVTVRGIKKPLQVRELLANNSFVS